MPVGLLDVLDAGLPGVVGGFTNRAGGVSRAPWDELNLAGHVGDDDVHVSANRDRLAKWIGADQVWFPEQVHGAGVVAVGRARPVDVRGVDAVVTAERGVPLGILVADCMPVLFADRHHGVVGAAHAGRRGLAAGVLQATLSAMVELGADPASTSAVIGPAICGRCYEVPEAMRAEVAAEVPGTATETRAGTPALDLPAGALRLLTEAGLSRVSTTGICTAEDERFYSYRRDGVTGRFAGVVMLEPDA